MTVAAMNLEARHQTASKLFIRRAASVYVGHVSLIAKALRIRPTLQGTLYPLEKMDAQPVAEWLAARETVGSATGFLGLLL